MPKVSVNIPCYNSAPFIKATLESVLNQTYKDFEIIVIDDGSTDDTEKIVKSIKDPRIKYLYKVNEGLSKARNRAIDFSIGEYIAFLDHDDLWLPDKLEKQIKLFEDNKGLGLVFSDTYVLKNNKKENATYFKRCKPKKGYIFEELLFGRSNFIPLLTVMMRKNIFKEIGQFKEEYVIGEEYELFLRAAEKYEFDYVNKPLATYRIHSGNTSNKKDIFAKETFDILNFWKKQKPSIFEKNQKKLLKKEADIFSELGDFYALNSNRKNAILNFNLSLKKENRTTTLFKKYIVSLTGSIGYKFTNGILGKLRHGN